MDQNLEPMHNSLPDATDEHFQTHMLQGVSRTFALTIPTLPKTLCRAVGNAYLLCRIADTIEDDAELSFTEKQTYSKAFLKLVSGEDNPRDFGHELAPKLAPHTSSAERELIRGTARVLRITHSMSATERRALERCVRIMTEGMVHYQGQETLDGLTDQAAMDRYCYYVAGVVGEMLTELFCAHNETIMKKRPELITLAVSFGQGLQMTNILKDIWDDRARGACWLPRDAFDARDISLSTLTAGEGGTAFTQVYRHLIAIAHGHLVNALRYTLLIPHSEPGIRRFCLWALGMAVLSLRKLNANPHFADGQEVKISRRSVRLTVAATSAAVGSDTALRGLFMLASTGLPKENVDPPPSPLFGMTDPSSSM